MPEPLPDEDIAPVDPFEVELVAYLDGELEAAAARRVEARLAVDPLARARATALKKTFDLLDYLPKPEPSATFATRTLDKLPALQPGSLQKQPQSQGAPATSQSQPKPARLSQSRTTAGASTRIPTQAEYLQAPLPLPTEPSQSRRMVWVAGILVAVAAFSTAGYFVGTTLRSHQSGSRSTAKDTAEELALADHRLIENLPLYAAVDDYAFVNDLAKPEYFGDDPTVSYDPKLNVPSLPPKMPSDTVFAALEKAFKLLSLERQQAIRELDKHLYAEPQADRDRLLRVLEAYAAWLSHLSEADRRGVLAAATAKLRLGQIRDIRNRQWFESLPLNQRNKLIGVNDSLNEKLKEEWKLEDKNRREDWADARNHPEKQKLDASRTPWPFDTEKGRNEVFAFAKTAFRLDDTKGIRLAANELDRYNNALSFAREQGGAAWYIYGRTLYELVKKHEEFLLPPPADPKTHYADYLELPLPYQKYALGRLKQKLIPLVGKWPEFALEVHKDVPQIHREMSKGDLKFQVLPPLGPSKVSDFTPAVRTFIENDLLKLLTRDERTNLQRDENKWPEYSRELIKLARHYKLNMPGVMLPGSPQLWDTQYGPSRNK